jgi:hypothetical protein
MAEPASRIEAANSFREPDTPGPRNRAKEKARPKREPSPALKAIEPDEPDEQEKHELDTMA